MKEQLLEKLQNAMQSWEQPEIPENIPHGDMPGDKVQIEPEHIQKTNKIFPELLTLLKQSVENSGLGKIVVSVCGGSGVGKSETASLLAWYLEQIGIGSYTMSGDNYPHRIPSQNDGERMRIFRKSGIKGLLTENLYTKERGDKLMELQEKEQDAEPSLTEEMPWLAVYQKEGRNGLSAYLGSSTEEDFEEVSQIITQFKKGADEIWMKRMGRVETALWYEPVDFSKINVLLLEWTHGNSRWIRGVDIPVLLNSTPEETKAHRLSRGRDGKVDTPFTTMVLEIEQKLLESQAEQAKIIISKSGDLLSYPEYRKLMAKEVI